LICPARLEPVSEFTPQAGKSVELIERTARPLADAALSVGFSDQSHFTRCFARQLGISPVAFWRVHRETT
tara:strand:- start:1975 stop:2184 length:210 start_codon:yes stop_codon:yes gene_type:complete